MTPATDDDELRRAFGFFPTGVTAICALVEGQPAGMAASSFNSVSLEPPLASVCMQNTSSTWRKLQGAKRLGVSFLADCHANASRQLAARTGDRFAGIEWHTTDAGAIFISGAAVWLDCSINRRISAGDHELILLQIEALKVEPNVSPLIFHGSRYRQLASL